MSNPIDSYDDALPKPRFDLDPTRAAVDVVVDATVGAILPGGNGYQAACRNFRMIASAVPTTAEAVAALGASGGRRAA